MGLHFSLCMIVHLNVVAEKTSEMVNKSKRKNSQDADICIHCIDLAVDVVLLAGSRSDNECKSKSRSKTAKQDNEDIRYNNFWYV